MSTQNIHKFTENASPDNWLKYAQELKESAVAMWKVQGKIIEINTETGEKIERPSISRVFILCCGLSIENLLKAYLVAIKPDLINKGFLDKILREHNLLNLSSICKDISFEKNEIELMDILSEAIPYWGRYPIPLHFNQLKTERIANENILETFKILFKKIFNFTYDKIENGWDAGNGVSYNKIIYKSFETD